MSSLKSFATALLISGVILLGNGSPIESRSGTSSEQITYILPIWEGALASHTRSDDLAVVNNITTMLGAGGTYTKTGWSFSSWALSRDITTSANDYNFDPTNLNYMLGLAVSASVPILVHMNNGRWADCCTPNSSGGWGDSLLDYIAAMPNTTVLDDNGNSLYGHNFGSNYFSLTRLNAPYRSYKKRNIQAAAAVIAAWGSANPGLFAGVSLDSETLMPNNAADYNLLAIQEWTMYLQNSGIYGSGGLYYGQGRIPAFSSIAAFNSAMGTSFASWSAVRPPNPITPGDPFWEEWERWRITLINHAVADMTIWIAAAGIDRHLVFGHQTPRIDDYGMADDLMTETAANGAGGVTYYGWVPGNFGEIDNVMRASGSNNWGVFELNPLTTDTTQSYNTMLTLTNDGIKVMCPNSWENEAVKDIYALFDSTNTGNTFGLQLKQFLSDHGNTPRTLQPPPWNPGTRVVDLYDLFPSATASGPDNHLEPSGSVGNIVRKCVYEAVGGVIKYSVTLPAVSSGQRLNFWTSLGIRDGAGSGGEVVFQAAIGSSNLMGPGIHLDKNYWLWKRWIPVMVDVTPWAGTTQTLTLTTTGSSTYGWTEWGSPAIYASTTTNNLALGKTVSVSSSETPAGWSPSYLVDGNVDGGTNGRIGWSSIMHSTAANTEWAVVDLGSSQSIGKVVLFARSDLVDFSGTGFPVNFLIQVSADNSNWSTLVTLTNYPSPFAGEGQIFTFVQSTARYVRVYATTLGGVGNEAGCRLQLGEIQVYA